MGLFTLAMATAPIWMPMVTDLVTSGLSGGGGGGENGVGNDDGLGPIRASGLISQSQPNPLVPPVGTPSPLASFIGSTGGGAAAGSPFGALMGGLGSAADIYSTLMGSRIAQKNARTERRIAEKTFDQRKKISKTGRRMFMGAFGAASGVGSNGDKVRFGIGSPFETENPFDLPTRGDWNRWARGEGGGNRKPKKASGFIG